jgi:hypothetical protein
MGEHLDEEAGSQYGYALELLCRHFGEVILPDAWGGVRWMAVEDASLVDPDQDRSSRPHARYAGLSYNWAFDRCRSRGQGFGTRQRPSDQ